MAFRGLCFLPLDMLSFANARRSLRPLEYLYVWSLLWRSAASFLRTTPSFQSRSCSGSSADLFLWDHPKLSTFAFPYLQMPSLGSSSSGLDISSPTTGQHEVQRERSIKKPKTPHRDKKMHITRSTIVTIAILTLGIHV